MLIDFLEVLSVNLHRLSHVVHWVAIRQFLVHVKCFFVSYHPRSKYNLTFITFIRQPF